ncbi:MULTISPECIES: transporter substrate-binding domain-containing protein [Rhizobium]|uniref:Extracellular solute-binding protein family 3 n=2 Tax=Rhizobium TaxID=379 RepID=K0PTA2_9HYPH|nr:MULTISPECIES: transporter substrate-binding domain-containing protein [Rhizobium]KWV43476.1 hypothetical protein AS026_19990 [Rhizobium altiplani]CCM79971.1 Extracellular solute-binding protein family 3 [Rhizobium mesoamericanum STM3625]
MNKTRWRNLLLAACALAGTALGPVVARAQDAKAALSQEVQKSGVLRIAIPDQGKPFAYKDGAALKGIDPDLAMAVSKKLGLKAEFSLVPFTAALAGMAAKKYDLSFGEFYVTAERLKVVDMVTSWHTFSSFLVKNDSNLKPVKVADMCGKSVASMAGSVELATLTKEAEKCDKPIKISAFPSTANAVLAVTSGRVNAVYADRGAVEEALSGNPGLAVNGQIGGGVTAIAVSRGDRAKGLNEAVKEAMDSLIESGEYQKILDANHAGFGAITKSEIYDASSTPPTY